MKHIFMRVFLIVTLMLSFSNFFAMENEVMTPELFEKQLMETIAKDEKMSPEERAKESKRIQEALEYFETHPYQCKALGPLGKFVKTFFPYLAKQWGLIP